MTALAASVLRSSAACKPNTNSKQQEKQHSLLVHQSPVVDSLSCKIACLLLLKQALRAAPVVTASHVCDSNICCWYIFGCRNA
jgi:hypothetical protein